MSDGQDRNPFVPIFGGNRQNDRARAVFQTFFFSTQIFSLPEVRVANDLASSWLWKQFLVFQLMIKRSCRR